MQQRKRYKQNQKPLRRPTQPDIESFRMPTLPVFDLKNCTSKSIQMKKTTTKRPKGSAKGRCSSVKYPIEVSLPLKQLYRSFKELHKVHTKDNSKSTLNRPIVTATRSKLKASSSGRKGFTSKVSLDDDVNLPEKITLTLHQLNENDYFRDEELVPIVSSSDAYTKQQLNILAAKALREFEGQPELFIDEVRNFCSKNAHIKAKSFHGIFDQAAIVIQRAWRKRRTQKIVRRYVELFEPDNLQLQLKDVFSSDRNRHEGFEEDPNQNYSQEQGFQLYSNIPTVQDQIDHSQEEQEQQKRDQEEFPSQAANENNLQQAIERIKLQELEKWNDIIRLIMRSKDGSTDAKGLLDELAIQSEENRKDLQSKWDQILTKRPRKLTVLASQSSSSSQEAASSRKGNEDFDSQKYRSYFDQDIYAEDILAPHFQPVGNGVNSISQHKVEAEAIRSKALRVFPEFDSGVRMLSHSQSLTLISKSHSSKGLKKSISEKFLLRSIRSVSPNIWIDEVELGRQQINEKDLETLTRQFLEGSELKPDQEDAQYTELKKKISKLHDLVKEIQQDDHHKQDEENTHKYDQNGSYPSHLEVETVNEQLQSSSDEDSKTQNSEKMESLAVVFVNHLIFELLKELSQSYPKLTDYLRKSAGQSRAKRYQSIRRPGFAATTDSIQTFIVGLNRYLFNQEPHILKNLEVPGGPSVLQLLSYMHEDIDEEKILESFDGDQSAAVTVLPDWIFNNYWRQFERSLFMATSEDIARQNQLRSWAQVFYRCVFEAYNECLDMERNYGVFGKPFPWKKVPQFYHLKNLRSIQISVARAERRLQEVMVIYCGIIVEKDELGGMLAAPEYIAQVQEDRLARMLSQDLLESEDRWTFYDDEETEVLVTVANNVFLELITQFCDQM